MRPTLLEALELCTDDAATTSSVVQWHHDRPPTLRGPTARPLHPNPVISAVARLSDVELGDMSTRDLLDMIRMTSHAGHADLSELREKGHTVLLQLGHYVRRGCRAEVNAHARDCGRSAHFVDVH